MHPPTEARSGCEQMQATRVSLLANARSLFANFAHIALLVGMSVGPSMAGPPAGPSPIEKTTPSGNAALTETDKLAAEIAKTQAELGH
jgi:hypothetical protein